MPPSSCARATTASHADHIRCLSSRVSKAKPRRPSGCVSQRSLTSRMAIGDLERASVTELFCGRMVALVRIKGAIRQRGLKLSLRAFYRASFEMMSIYPRGTHPTTQHRRPPKSIRYTQYGDAGRLHDKGYTPALNLQHDPKKRAQKSRFRGAPPPFAMKKLHPYSPRSGQICRYEGTEGYFLDQK